VRDEPIAKLAGDVVRLGTGANVVAVMKLALRRAEDLPDRVAAPSSFHVACL
jgi:hypothetical protein